MQAFTPTFSLVSILPLCDSHSFPHSISCAVGAWIPWALAFPSQPCLPLSSDPMLPGLGPVCCSSSLSSGFKLLRPKVQQVQSSLRLLTYLFVPVTCWVTSSPTKPMRRSSLELAWFVQAQTKGLLWTESRDRGLVKDHEILLGAGKLALKNADHLCRKTGCQPLTDPVIQVLQPVAKGF